MSPITVSPPGYPRPHALTQPARTAPPLTSVGGGAFALPSHRRCGRATRRPPSSLRAVNPPDRAGGAVLSGYPPCPNSRDGFSRGERKSSSAISSTRVRGATRAIGLSSLVSTMGTGRHARLGPASPPEPHKPSRCCAVRRGARRPHPRTTAPGGRGGRRWCSCRHHRPSGVIFDGEGFGCPLGHPRTSEGNDRLIVGAVPVSVIR